MFYKLSNTAKLSELEDFIEVKFEFPNIYKPNPIINGLNESNIPVITMEDLSKVRYGIWGMLPVDLEDNWDVFQNLTNTLNVQIDNLEESSSFYTEALDKRRCLLIVTGFFTSIIYEGKLIPYHVHMPNYRPFGLAGVYSRLEDGFLTCSLLIDQKKSALSNLPNMFEYEPIVVNKKNYSQWLDQTSNFDDAIEALKGSENLKLIANPVSKEFYDNDVIFSDLVGNSEANKFPKTL